MGFSRSTPPIAGSQNSVSELTKLKIGGIDQWVLIRGKNRDNPILLFLHGGPGSAQIAVARKYHSLLEEHFIVVNWDQRGAGLSYSPDIPVETMTIEHFIKDTKELIEYLVKTYHKDKIFLAGHSWGSVLGVLVSQRYPQLIHAYIGIGQAVDLDENERLAYQYVYEYAQKNNHKKALKELQEIGELPCKDIKHYTRVRSRWTSKFGARFRNMSMTQFMLEYLRSSEYTQSDVLKFIKGSNFSFNTLWEEVMKVNLFKLAPELSMPVYFLLGRYDYTTPYDIAVRYFEKLIAPHKELIWFEKSAHAMPFEEPEEFQRVLIEKLRGLEVL